MAPEADLSQAQTKRVEEAIAAIRGGKMVILVDDEDRENEGDLCMAAECVTAEAINFMATHGRGLICLTITEEQVDRLDLPMMSRPGRRGPPLGTAFTVSIEARSGVTTGISAADRAHTIRVASAPTARPDDLVTPGHVFPLQARRGGVLVRTGQTEGSVDLARLAGLNPAGVICEIMNPDGTMARVPDLRTFAKTHDLVLLSVEDLIAYRLRTERMVRRIDEREILLDQTQTNWTLSVFDVLIDDRQFVALWRGKLDPAKPTLCRVHAGNLLADLFSSTPRDGGKNLRAAIEQIEHAGTGVILYLPSIKNPLDELNEFPSTQAKRPTNPPPLYEFGLGAQCLVELGVQHLRLMTNSTQKMAGLHGFGIEVVERVPLVSGARPA